MMGVETQCVLLIGIAIDLLTAVVVAYHVGWALVLIVRGRGSDAAKAVVADGVIAGLGFGVAGSLLKTIALGDWPHLRMFAFVFVFRTLLKRVFQQEQLAVTRRLDVVASSTSFEYQGATLQQ